MDPFHVVRSDDHVEVEVTWGIYQRLIAAYHEPDRARAKQAMSAVIEALREGAPAALTELRNWADSELVSAKLKNETNGPRARRYKAPPG